MTDFSALPRLTRAGFVVLDRASGRPRRVIRFQYNPDQFTRSLELRESDDHGPGTPPVETFGLEAELNADDIAPGRPALVTGVAARLAALAALVTPRVAEQQRVEAQAAAGVLELREEPGDPLLFNWGPSCIAPVRITELRIVEEAFAADLTPIRARVSLALRVIRPQDVRAGDLRGGFALAYQHQRQALADRGNGDQP